MPLPTPRGDESEQDFVGRFMGNDQAVADFPDETQRAAVAYRTYRDEDEMEELELPGVSILEEGEAKGHDLFVDKVSLEKALEIMKSAKNGVKVKMNHGSRGCMTRTTMGALVPKYYMFRRGCVWKYKHV